MEESPSSADSLLEGEEVPAVSPVLAPQLPLGLVEVTDPPRPLPAGMDGQQPLVTFCWRILREEQERIRGEQQRQLAAMEGALTCLALEAHALGRHLRINSAREGAGSSAVELAGLEAIRRRMLHALESCDVRLLAPEGEPFSGNLLEMFDSVAQQPESGLTEARITEVIAPAVLWKGVLARQGKAVVAVPGPPSSQKGPASAVVE